jgi:drug/metabolite transporter (DMT)-like permease
MPESNSKDDGSLVPHIALITVQILFGTWPILGKIALREIPPTELVALRTFGAALVFLILNRRFGGSQKIEPDDRYRIAFYGLLGVAANQLLFVKGLSMTTAISATLLQTSIPIFAYLIGIATRADYLSVRKAIGIALAISGVFLMVGPAAGFSGSSIEGNLFILGNSFCYGTYIAFSRDMVRKYGPLKLITWNFVTGSLVTVPLGIIGAFSGPQPAISRPLVIGVVVIILFPTVAAYFLNAWALTQVRPSVVTVYTYLQPLFVFSIAPLWLGERLTGTEIIASAAIIVGVIAVTWKSTGKVPEADLAGAD